MKQISKLFILFSVVMMTVSAFGQKGKSGQQPGCEYVILASMAVKNDAAWMNVVNALQEKHKAEVLFYNKAQRERLGELKSLRPRYVAIVDKPENLEVSVVVDIHCLSREVDEDIFEDFLWGIITGYDAEAAMKMVNNSTESLVIKDAIASISELKSAKWFDRFGWVDDHIENLWGEKMGVGQQVTTGTVPGQLIETFVDLYVKYDPDLVVTASHATEWNLEMPYSDGIITPRNGKLMANSDKGQKEIKNTGKRRVYFPVGNCLIGNVGNSKESMAIAWMNGANVTTMVGYVVPTWYGRAGWGGLKYWLTTPGRYTLAEAIFLNQQDLLNQHNGWNPDFLKRKFPYRGYGAGLRNVLEMMTEDLGREPSLHEMGFWHDRDVLVYYGDPKWDVRLKEIPEESDFTVTSKVKGNKCVITITTKENFNLERMKGDHFKQEHVSDLPFSYFFPQRLNNPRLAKGQNWKVALDENFLLIYNADLKPNQTYKVTLDIDK